VPRRCSTSSDRGDREPFRSESHDQACHCGDARARGLAGDHRDPFALNLRREFLWDPARQEPEFQTLLGRVGLACGRAAHAS